jgi:hypothetical protein
VDGNCSYGDIEREIAPYPRLPYSNLIVLTDGKLAIILVARRYNVGTNMELAKLVNLIHDILWLRKIDLTANKVKGHANDPGNK